MVLLANTCVNSTGLHFKGQQQKKSPSLIMIMTLKDSCKKYVMTSHSKECSKYLKNIISVFNLSAPCFSKEKGEPHAKFAEGPCAQIA